MECVVNSDNRIDIKVCDLFELVMLIISLCGFILFLVLFLRLNISGLLVLVILIGMCNFLLCCCGVYSVGIFSWDVFLMFSSVVKFVL